MLNNPEKFIQSNSPDGGFLQSEEWQMFQESVDRKTFHLDGEGFWANIIKHTLPIVGKYFYIPRGPVMQETRNKKQETNKLQNLNDQIYKQMQGLVKLAEDNNAGWIRVDVESEEKLKILKKEFFGKIKKAPHDMQPKEVFIIDIAKTEDELLAKMKSKTRYNIRLAEKKDVKVFASREKKYVDEFLRLVKMTAARDGIVAHAESYYRKMMEIIPEKILKLYVAEYEGQVIAANLVIFYGETCTYMHGASDDEHRNVMAPFLLQWRQMQDAKKFGCKKYDFGGVNVVNSKTQETSDKQISSSNIQTPKTTNQKPKTNNWAGITRFKTGFSPETESTKFCGSYDIIISYPRYILYKTLQYLKKLKKLR